MLFMVENIKILAKCIKAENALCIFAMSPRAGDWIETLQEDGQHTR